MNGHFSSPARGRQTASPVGHAPAATDTGRSIEHGGFRITTRKLPILKADPIEQMSSKLGIAVPEMIFGDNTVTIEHVASAWAISFNTFDALDRVDKTGESMLQVAHSEAWKGSRQGSYDSITSVVKPFDWSYTTDYRGTLAPPSTELTPSSASIPISLLQRPDPIIFFDEVMLYEDEMADNGITMLSVKVRVMPARLLLLCRFFMRLDGVIFRMRDTRVFIEFSEGRVLREYVEKEQEYEAVRMALATRGEDVLATMRDPNALAAILPELKRSTEEATIT